LGASEIVEFYVEACEVLRLLYEITGKWENLLQRLVSLQRLFARPLLRLGQILASWMSVRVGVKAELLFQVLALASSGTKFFSLPCCQLLLSSDFVLILLIRYKGLDKSCYFTYEKVL
jgi:hypothetical protein